MKTVSVKMETKHKPLTPKLKKFIFDIILLEGMIFRYKKQKEIIGRLPLVPSDVNSLYKYFCENATNKYNMFEFLDLLRTVEENSSTIKNSDWRSFYADFKN